MVEKYKKDPKLWTEIEWKNCYALYEAVQTYELDDSISFDAFKEKVLNDDNFRVHHKLKQGMDKEDYDPW